MTIAEYLLEVRKGAMEERLARLIELDAPDVLIVGVRQALEAPLKGVGKLKEFGHVEFNEATDHTGRGGRPYIRFANSSGEDILYVKGQWGWHLYRQKKGARQ